MLFGDLADDIYPYAGVIGGAVGIAVGLYHYWKGSDKQDDDKDNELATEPHETVCPHCQARFASVGDPFCPDCRQPLNESPKA